MAPPSAIDLQLSSLIVFLFLFLLLQMNNNQLQIWLLVVHVNISVNSLNLISDFVKFCQILSICQILSNAPNYIKIHDIEAKTKEIQPPKCI